jgi:hypothetical protein
MLHAFRITPPELYEERRADQWQERIARDPPCQDRLARLHRPAHRRCVRARPSPPADLIPPCLESSGGGAATSGHLRLPSYGGNCRPNSQPFTHLARTRRLLTPGAGSPPPFVGPMECSPSAPCRSAPRDALYDSLVSLPVNPRGVALPFVPVRDLPDLLQPQVSEVERRNHEQDQQRVPPADEDFRPHRPDGQPEGQY